MRLDIGIAFPFQCGVDQAVIVRLRDFALLAFHIGQNVPICRALDDNATRIGTGSRYCIDNVLVLRVDEGISLATRSTSIKQMRSGEGVGDILALRWINQIRGTNVAVGVIETPRPMTHITGCADGNLFLAVGQRARENHLIGIRTHRTTRVNYWLGARCRDRRTRGLCLSGREAT